VFPRIDFDNIHFGQKLCRSISILKSLYKYPPRKLQVHIYLNIRDNNLELQVFERRKSPQFNFKTLPKYVGFIRKFRPERFHKIDSGGDEVFLLGSTVIDKSAAELVSRRGGTHC
jgi:hypothetical protein